MKAGNVKLMAAAAVVIVLCLLFAFVTYDDGDDDARLGAAYPRGGEPD